jgi:hypothetical protein
MPADDTTAAADPGSPAPDNERRVCTGDRRENLLYSLWYGGMRPRRRSGRRIDDRERPIIDWHAPTLLASAFLILLLCVADAILTLALISAGAREANPVMALFVYGDARRFVLTKLALTGGGVLLLVACARFRVFRLLRADTIVHGLLVAYLLLITYELSLAADLT